MSSDLLGLWWGMDSISRYHISPHDDGSWRVIDTTSGEPAEVLAEGSWTTLYKLSRVQAEWWSTVLNLEAGMFKNKNFTSQERE